MITLLLSGRDGGFGRPVLEELEKPLHLFDLMRRHKFLDRNNIIYLQAMLYKIGRPDLYDSAIEYAHSVGEAIHLSKPPREPGIVNARLLLLDVSLTVKAATLIFISGCGSAISSAKEGKSGFIYNSVKS